MIIRCQFNEMLSVDILKTLSHTKNPNKHPKEQIERLAEILKYQGIRHPIVVATSPRKVMTKGHGRLLAAIENGWHEFPVQYQDYECEEMLYADIVADNAIASWAELDLTSINLEIPDLGPDFDLDQLGIKDFVLEPADKYGDQDADDVPLIRPTDIKIGDLFLLGNHRLLCGDSTDSSMVSRLMNGEKADMVYTDPPYGLNWSGGTWAAKAHIQKAREWDRKPSREQIDFILSLSDQIILWGGNYFQVPPSRCWLSWKKSNANQTMSDFELAWTSLDQCCKQFESGHTIDGKRMHATQKPIALAEWAMQRCEGVRVLDLYGGSGSTLIACERRNKKCFMAEIDPQYCQIIIDRWEKFTSQKAAKLEDETESR